MQKFLIKASVFLLLLVSTIYLYIFFLADSATDPYYGRFTTGKYRSLVLGTSRAAQGIDPEILNGILSLRENEIFNYSFTVNRSQWGEPYLKSISKKLDTINNNGGVFILECNVWAFCSKEGQIGNFLEAKTPPNSIKRPNSGPNIQYFFGGFEDLNFSLLFRRLFRGEIRKQSYVDKHGRYVINIAYDSVKVSNNVKRKIVMYEQMAKEYVPDSIRMNSFKNTINYLNRYGAVYLIRMPIAEEMLNLESVVYPDFNNQMNSVSKEFGVPYLDFTHLSNKYNTIDGNHLHNKYITYFNKLLALEILKSKTSIGTNK